MTLAVWHGLAADESSGDLVVLASPSVTVTDRSDGSTPQVYDDRDGNTALGNPFTAGSDGDIEFYVPPGRYKIEASANGNTVTWDDELIGTLHGIESPADGEIPQYDDANDRYTQIAPEDLNAKPTDPEHATDSGTDTYDSATNTSPPADGVVIIRDFQSASTTTTPTLDGKTITTRDGSDLWANAIDGHHALEYASGTDTYLLLDPVLAQKQAATLLGGNVFEGAQVFNEAGADVDFRIEGDTDPNLFFVDASEDKIGIGTNAPSQLLHARRDQDAPTEGIMENQNAAGTSTIVEWRCLNDVGAADFGITGSSFSDGSPLAGNEAFIVAESSTVGLNLKNNNNSGGWIRFVTGDGTSLVEAARLNGKGAFCFGHSINDIGSAGLPLIANDKSYSAVNSAGDGTIGLMKLNTNDQLSLFLNNAFLEFTGAATISSAGSVAEYIRVLVGGTERRIPLHATS